MTVYTLRPTSDVLNYNSLPTTLGQAHWANLSDNNDSSWVQFAGPNPVRDLLGLGDLPALAADEQVVRVRVRVRYDTGFGVTNTYVTLQNNVNQRAPSDLYTATIIYGASFTGPWKYQAPDGGPWAPARVNELLLDLQDIGGGTTLPRFYEAYVDVETNRKPHVGLTGPVSPVTDTMTPTVTAFYTDYESDPLDAYQIKVFSHSADPSVATDAIYDSGVVSATGTSISNKITTPLANGLWHVYIRARQGGAVIQQWSDWTPVLSFTVAVTPALPPLLSLAVDDANGRISIRLTDQGPALASGVRRFEVERQYVGGQWTRLERLWPQMPMSGYSYTSAYQALNVFDYEAKRDAGVWYRARVRSELASGTVTVSDWTMVLATIGNPLLPKGWRLKPVSNPSIGILFYNSAEEWRLSSTEKVMVAEALGRASPVFISDGMSSEEGELEMVFLDQYSFDCFEAIRARREVNLLQSPYGDHIYVRLLGKRDAGFRLNGGRQTKRTVVQPFRQTDAP